MLRPAVDLVRELRQLGAEIDVADGGLRITAPAGALTDESKKEITASKSDILALFSESLRLLNERGVRIIHRRGGDVFALWRDADGRDVRNAIEVLGHADIQVLHLDDPEADIPTTYRQCVPECVKKIWERAGLLATPAQRLESEAKARRINRLFDTLGTSPQPSRITAATVLHGILAQNRRCSD